MYEFRIKFKISQLSNKRNLSVKLSKCIQTELQELIAYGLYDKENILKAGKLLNKDELIALTAKKFLLSNDKNNDCLSEVNKFIKGIEKYEYFFNSSDETSNMSALIDTERDFLPEKYLIIP